MKAFVSARVTERWLDALRQRFEAVDHYDWFAAGRFLSPPEMIIRLQGCDVLITESDEITADIIDAALDLKIIVDCRGTPVNVDLEAATRRGIPVINAPGRNAEAVADMTVALMVMVGRNILPGVEAMREGRWYEGGMRWCYVTFQGNELAHKVVGLVGLGAIGELVAHRLSGFDVDLLAYDPYVAPEDMAALGIESVTLDDLLRRSDYVSLHAPLNDETRGMIGAREFSQMKPTAYFINTARASLTDEKALIDLLDNKCIAGAALDVFHKEPVPADYPLLHLPHVVATPHLGGATHDVIDHQSRIAVLGLLSLLDGDPKNIVNLDTLCASGHDIGKL
jgi:phosphoglycerate dehydrogenase-like enzyme